MRMSQLEKLANRFEYKDPTGKDEVSQMACSPCPVLVLSAHVFGCVMDPCIL